MPLKQYRYCIGCDADQQNKMKTELKTAELTYTIVLYTKGDKYPSDSMSAAQARAWIKKNSRKAFTVSEELAGEYRRELTREQALKL